MLKPHNRAELEFHARREIGQEGKNSTAYIVEDVQLGAEIVMKRLDKRKIASQEEYFSEAKALYSTAHQNVVPVLYACEDRDFVYIALPYFENGSLKSLMSDQNLTVRQIVRISCQLLSGLHNIHSKGLIHFDVKPDNVLLSKRGDALLSDFGLAKQMYGGEAWQNRFYMPIVPPEQLAGPPFNLQYDIYQFGLTLYSMCCGEGKLRAQFDGLNGNVERFAQALENETYPDRSIFPEHIPDRLKRVIVRCLRASPGDRFPSALSVANELAKIDQCLDWTHEEADGKKIWVRSDGETLKRFVWNADGSTKFTSSRNGQTRRKTALCCQRMTSSRVRKALKDEG